MLELSFLMITCPDDTVIPLFNKLIVSDIHGIFMAFNNTYIKKQVNLKTSTNQNTDAKETKKKSR